jgi:branched-chain amino acid transport system ATP-binding protein
MTVLSATGISVRFGGVRALTDVTVSVPAGRIVGLIGPNGAGKTTLVDALTGFVRCDGRVRLDGRDLSGRPPHVRARRGLARTWQSIELFDDLTVRENLMTAARRRSIGRMLAGTLAAPPAPPDSVGEALALLGLKPVADMLASELSQGERTLVGLGRVLAARPRVICLDEPAAGLDTRESEQLGRRLRAVADAGTAMLLVDHDLGLVLGICDEVVVLEFGRVLAAGTPEQVRHDPRVIAAYLGTDAAGNAATTSAAAPDPAAAPEARPVPGPVAAPGGIAVDTS